MYRILLICIVAIAILAGGLYFVLSQAPVPHVAAPQLSTTTTAEATDTYTIDAQYPQFGLPLIDVQLKKLETDAIAELKAQPPVPHDMSVATNTFTGRFDAPYIGPDYVSVELSLSEYTGGAHPNTLFAGVAFDKKTGKRLDLADALSLIGKSLDEVSSSSVAQLTQTIDNPSGIFAEGALPKPENFAWFTVSDTAVTFIFQQYQVAPYSFGPQRVSFARVR
jgi:hypothetical protein